MKILITGDVSDWNIPNGFNIKDFNPHLLKKFKNIDLLISNLEGPIVENPNSGSLVYREGKFLNILYKIVVAISKSYQPKVYSSKKILELLKIPPKTVVTTANNHIKDCGKEGFLETQTYLRKNNISFIGGENSKVDSNNVLMIEEKLFLINTNWVGKKFGLDLFGSSTGSFGSSSLSIEDIKKSIELIKKSDGKVILMLHAGKELEKDICNWDFQLNKIKDLNADLAVIIHPHIYIKTEWEKDNIFVLGDFIFSRPGKLEKDRETAFLEVEFKNKYLSVINTILPVNSIFKYK